MEIIQEIINKILIFVFCLSVINIIKHVVMFYIIAIAPENPSPYVLNEKQKLYLAFSLAAIITILIIQFKLF